MKKNWVGLLGLILSTIIVIGFSGCEKKETAKSTSEKEKVEISLAHIWVGADPKAPVYTAVWERFRSANPNVVLEVEEVPSSGYRDKLNTWIASESMPDVTLTWVGQWCKKIYNAGLAASIKPWIDEDPQWKNSFMEGALEQFAIDGDIYLLPNEFFCVPIYCNKEILSQHGINEPETWNEFMDALKIVHEKGDKFAIGMFSKVTSDDIIFYTTNIVGASGVEQQWVNAVEGRSSFNTPEIIEVFRKVRQLYDYAQPGFNNSDFMQGVNVFRSGQAAFFSTGTWGVGMFGDGPEGEAFLDKVSVLPIPQIIENRKDYVGTGVAMGWCASSALTKAEIPYVKKLFKEITSKKTTQDYLDLSDGLNCIRLEGIDTSNIGKLNDAIQLIENTPSPDIPIKSMLQFKDHETNAKVRDLLDLLVNKKLSPEELVIELDNAYK